MKRQLTVIAAALAIATAIGAVIGFIRTRLERMKAADVETGIVGFDIAAHGSTRDRATAVNGNRR